MVPEIPETVDNPESVRIQCKLALKDYHDAEKKYVKGIVDQEKYARCIARLRPLIVYIDKLNMLELEKIKDCVCDVYYTNADLLVKIVGIDPSKIDKLTDNDKNHFFIALVHLRKCLAVDPLNSKVCGLFKVVALFSTMYESNQEKNLVTVKDILSIVPWDCDVQHAMGIQYMRLNKLADSIQHFKTALGFADLHISLSRTETEKKMYLSMKAKIFNSIAQVHLSIQDHFVALYFLMKSYEIHPDDPDTNNQIGVVYTNLRIVDKAIFHYTKGITAAEKSFASSHSDMLASMHMNIGLVRCYECDFQGAIADYNKALTYNPKLSLAFQNKLLDMNYISHLIEDPMYVSKLHKAINKIYPKVISNYRESLPHYKPKTIGKDKLRLGFVSGDFICHPVAYFTTAIFSKIDYSKFEVYGYSMKLVDMTGQYPNCNWSVVKGLSDTELAAKIKNDHIDILFDLSTHTGDNRLDAFVLKPAPIQICYCGYPNTSGIKAMDYRITDTFCDSIEHSQKYYIEKFLFMDRSFLCYTPTCGFDKLVPLATLQPAIKNEWITFGCFNRFNKINETVIGTYEEILVKVPTARFVIKTREFLTEKIKQKFIDTFKDKSVLDRITILDFADTNEGHLDQYNLIDISLDTFPYSGTTTSCESLLMGVPILTWFDTVRHYHSQNVTTSLLKNSKLSEFVAYSRDEYVSKAIEFAKDLKKLENLKENVRTKFIEGYVCDSEYFIKDFQEKLTDTYISHFTK